ncbi:MAG: SRPBCC domain-containing protein [Novosphingobium sp.]|nr:SRPBCC domain-containing protein [Novosphingobium sp.]
MKPAISVLATLGLLGVTPASAEVVAASPMGLTSHNAVRLKATPEQAWAVLVKPKLYWSAEHSWSGDAANLTLDPHAGGCFCEALPRDAGSVEHMRVIFVRPDQELRMAGALGPFQSEALTGTLTVTLKPIPGGTEMDWTYKLGGYTQLDLVQFAPIADGVVGEQLNRLAAVVGKLD